jgi:hypothetical protein
VNAIHISIEQELIVEESPKPFDPYTPPQTQGYQPPVKKMSGGAKAVCIIALILGVLGLGQATIGGVGLVVGPRAQQWFNPPQPDENLRDLQREMQGEMNAVAERFLPFSIARVLFHLVVAVLLVIGGIIMLSSQNPKILLIGSALAIVFEISRAILQTTIQLQMIPIMTRSFERIGEMSGDMPGGFPQYMSYFMYGGLIFGLFFVLAKIVFYAISIVVLRKSNPAVETL